MPPGLFALHGLWCCGVIRARIDHPGFCALARRDLVVRRRIGETQGTCIYALTPLGQQVAVTTFEGNLDEPK